MPEFKEYIVLKNNDNETTILISPAAKTLTVKDPGGASKATGKWITDKNSGAVGKSSGKWIIDKEPVEWGSVKIGSKDIWVRGDDGNVSIQVDGENSRIYVGGDGSDGDIIVSNKDKNKVIHLDGKDAKITLGGDGNDGDIWISDKDGNETIHLGGEDARIYLGGDGNDGDIWIADKDGNETINLDGEKSRIYLGGDGNDGDIWIADKDNKKAIRVKGDSGSLSIYDEEGNPLIHLEGRSSEAEGSGGLFEGLAELAEAVATPIYLSGVTGTIMLGGGNTGGNLYVLNKENKQSVKLNGEQGNVTLPNANCAEEFPVSTTGEVEPGSVMIIGDDGLLTPCEEDGDSRVIGVISGADGYKPGIILDRDPDADNRVPIATMGKVYCKVDADQHPVNTGDLLTSSSVAGHAMRVSDGNAGTGAVIGKALAPLENGRDMIPVLVMLR